MPRPRQGARNAFAACLLSLDRLIPMLLEVILRLLELILGQDDRLSFNLRKLADRRLVHGACLGHGIEAYWTGKALKPDILPFVGIKEFLPKARGGGMRRI